MYYISQSFREVPLLSVRSELNPRKTLSPDLLRAEMFQLTPHFFSHAFLELRWAWGRTDHVPTVLNHGILSLIYKQKGNNRIPTNNIPVCITSSISRQISTPLIYKLLHHYRHTLLNRCGFQHGKNTECFISFETSALRRRLPRASILYLKK